MTISLYSHAYFSSLHLHIFLGIPRASRRRHLSRRRIVIALLLHRRRVVVRAATTSTAAPPLSNRHRCNLSRRTAAVALLEVDCCIPSAIDVSPPLPSLQSSSSFVVPIRCCCCIVLAPSLPLYAHGLPYPADTPRSYPSLCPSVHPRSFHLSLNFRLQSRLHLPSGALTCTSHCIA